MEILEIGKKILQAIQESDNVAANQLILEFQGMALELQETNYQQRRQIEALEAQVNLVGEMVFDNGVYWRTIDEEREGPFCQRCLDVDRIAVRLQRQEQRGQGYSSRWFACHGCGKHYDY